MAARTGVEPIQAPAPLLRVDGLRKAFAGPPRVDVLADVSFSVREGEFVSVVGPSGCGKTTLLLALAGLQARDGGNVEFAGAAVRDRTPEGMAIVFQDYSRSLLPWKTNLGNVLFGMHRFKEQSAAEKTGQAMALLRSVGSPGLNGIILAAVRRHAAARRHRARPRVALAPLLLSTSLSLRSTRRRAPTTAGPLLGIAARYGQTCGARHPRRQEATYMGDPHRRAVEAPDLSGARDRGGAAAPARPDRDARKAALPRNPPRSAVLYPPRARGGGAVS